jgi:hypothetical protein
MAVAAIEISTETSTPASSGTEFPAEPKSINAIFLADPELSLNEKARMLSRVIREANWHNSNRTVRRILSELDLFDERDEQYMLDPVVTLGMTWTAQVDFDYMVIEIRQQAEAGCLWIATTV